MLMVVNGFIATSLYSSPVCFNIPARSSVNIAMHETLAPASSIIFLLVNNGIAFPAGQFIAIGLKRNGSFDYIVSPTSAFSISSKMLEVTSIGMKSWDSFKILKTLPVLWQSCSQVLSSVSLLFLNCLLQYLIFLPYSIPLWF